MDTSASAAPTSHHYGPDLARIHHEGFAFHVDRTADGILGLMAEAGVQPGARVLDVGCGSGLLARRLLAHGYHVHGVDASPAMLELARAHAPEASFSQRSLPDHELPAADAVVSTGHVLNYLPTTQQVLAAVAAVGRAVRPGGVAAFDLMTTDYADHRNISDVHAFVEPDWTIVTRFSRPQPHQFVRHITAFAPAHDDCWRRTEETHLNVMVDPQLAMDVLAGLGMSVELRDAFGAEQLPAGLKVVVARAPSD
jgi:SAM-dependent methyltransferase